VTGLRILGRVTSSNVRKVLWTADLIGLDYEHEDWGLPLRDPKVPEFLTLNPNGTVPVIVDDGFVLWESNAILRYLGAQARSGLWPADARQRAIVDQWMSWQASDLAPAWAYAVAARLRGTPPDPDPAQLAASIANWTKKMRILAAHLDGRVFVSGDSFSFADIVIGLSTHRWMNVPFDRPELPAIDAHYRRMQARPAGAPWLGAQTP
jgi:glutathione S-transferase